MSLVGFKSMTSCTVIPCSTRLAVAACVLCNKFPPPIQAPHRPTFSSLYCGSNIPEFGTNRVCVLIRKNGVCVITQTNMCQ